MPASRPRKERLFILPPAIASLVNRDFVVYGFVPGQKLQHQIARFDGSRLREPVWTGLVARLI